MIRVYQHHIEITDRAIDGNGHVNNVQYVQWMQDAAIAHSDAAGCSQATREAGATWVIRSHHVEYLRPAFKGEKLVTLTWVSNFKRVRSLRKYRFLRESDHAVIAEGQTDWVFVDMTTGRPLPIPSQVAASFEIVPEDAEPVDFE